MEEDNTITTDEIVNQLTYQYNMGYKLKRIYDELMDVLGMAKSPWIFCEFVKRNKNNKEFMKEFDSTSFVEQICFNSETQKTLNIINQKKRKMKITKLKNARKFSFQELKNLTAENIELEAAKNDTDICIHLFRKDAEEVEFECIIDKFELAKLIGLETEEPKMSEYLDGNSISYNSTGLQLIEGLTPVDFAFNGYEKEIIEFITNNKKIEWK